jgi:short-subunit dehydrogenase
VPFDLNDTGRIHELVRDLRERFGPIYGLVNNAGLGTEGILATMPEASIEKLVQLNVVSPLVLTKYVVRSMMMKVPATSSTSLPSSPAPGIVEFPPMPLQRRR